MYHQYDIPTNQPNQNSCQRMANTFPHLSQRAIKNGVGLVTRWSSVLALCFSLIFTSAWAAEFTNITTTNGLGSNVVYGVYVSGTTIYAATGGGLSISTDSGNTFTTKTTTNGLGSNKVHGISVSGTTIYAATEGGLSISTDSGKTFTTKTITDGLGNNVVYGVSVSGTKIYAATWGGLSFSTNGGNTFGNIPGFGWGLGSGVLWGVSVSGTTIYAATMGGLSFSTNGYIFTNKDTTNGLGSNCVLGVYVSGITIYAATIGGLSISTDGGLSFTTKTTTNGLGSDVVNGVYVSGTTIYAATSGGLSISTDDGLSFTTKTTTNGLGSNVVYGVSVSGSTIYAATNGGLSFTTPPLPTAPTNLTATATSPTQIDLSWFDNSSDETGFKIESPAGTLISTTVANVTSYSHTGLTCGTTYNYAVKATNAGGDSMPVTGSFTTQACPLPQTITSITPTSATYGNGPLTLSATGGASGNPVTFNSTTTGVCTTNGSTLTILSVGTCTVTADQLGNTNYNAATQVTQTLTMAKKALTATVKDKSRVYGVTNPAFDFTYSGGWVGSDTATVLDTLPTATSTATSASNAGTYPITCINGSDNNYALTCVNGTLTVTPATQTISYTGPTTATYGVTPLALAALGGGSGNAITFTSSPATVCTTAGTYGETLTVVGAGTCTVTANQAGNTNYNAATPVTPTLTIAKKTITATVNNANRAVGAANPAFTISYTGLATGDTSAAITTPPTASTLADNSSLAGSYLITCSYSGSGGNNYTIGSCANGTLAVGLASPTFTMSPASGYIIVNHPVTINYDVTSTGPTPTGNVTINDGTDTCTDTVAVKKCTLTPTTSGVKTLTATYPSDGNYANATTTATLNVTEVILTPTGVNVTEGGATATYTVKLATPPASEVTITLTPDAQVTVNPMTLTFTPANGTTAQTVTVTAIDDAVVEGSHTGTITQAITTGDNAGYDMSMNIASVTATITDDDTLPVVVTPPPVVVTPPPVIVTPTPVVVTSTPVIVTTPVVTAPSTNGESTGGFTSTPPPNQLTLFIQVDGTGSGSVSTNTGRVCRRQNCQMNPNGEVNCKAEACREIVNTGDYVTLTPQADSGSVFTNWGGNEDCLDGKMFMNGSKLCIAFFHRIYELTVTLQGPGQVMGYGANPQPVIDCGSKCQAAVSDGTRISLQATPSQGMTFGGWSGDCENSTQNPLTLAVTQDLTCQAIFIMPTPEVIPTPVTVTPPVTSSPPPVVVTPPVTMTPETTPPVVITPIVTTETTGNVPITSPTVPVTTSNMPEVSTATTVETTLPPVVIPTTEVTPAPVVVTPPPVVTILPVTIVGANFSCDTTGSIGEVCNYGGREVTDLNVQNTGLVSNGLLKTTVVNTGWISNFHITTTGQLRGGVVTGYIKNEGIMLDFDFKGMSVIGGTLGGVITNTSKVGGYFQDVTLLPNAKITGGILKGTINGDKKAPALLENVRVKKGSKLSGVKLGKKVKLEKGVQVEN